MAKSRISKPKRIELTVDRGVSRRIHALGKKHFPREMFAALIGTASMDSAKLLDIWVPDDLTDHSAKSHVIAPAKWAITANEYAYDHGMTVIGSVHSHPVDESTHYPYWDASPSEGDWESSWSNICGILSLVKLTTGKMRGRLKFFGPAVSVRTQLTSNLR